MLLLLLSIGQIMAQLSISASNTEIKNVLRQIEEKSDYTFFYSDNFLDLNQKVTINTRNETIENTLNTLFRNTNIAYRINNTQIALSERTVRQAPGVTGQQQAKKTISGTITDNNGETVIGATIVEKSNPTNGTITDIDGNFSLSVAPNAELEISYVGFQPQTISISGRNTVNVILKEDVQTLDEVVVVGYGVQKKVNVIGSIASVDSKKLESRPAPSVSNMLTGQM